MKDARADIKKRKTDESFYNFFLFVYTQELLFGVCWTLFQLKMKNEKWYCFWHRTRTLQTQKWPSSRCRMNVIAVCLWGMFYAGGSKRKFKFFFFFFFTIYQENYYILHSISQFRIVKKTQKIHFLKAPGLPIFSVRFFTLSGKFHFYRKRG